MQELWNHELDANTHEAGEAENIIYQYRGNFFFWDIQTYNHTRFYSQVLELQCKVPCEGKPIMRLHGEVHSCFSYYFWLLHFILLPGSICVWTKLLYWVFWVEKDRKRQAPLPGNSKKHKWRFTFQTYGWWCLTWFQSYIDFKMLLDCSSKGGLEILLWVKNIFCAMYHCQHKKSLLNLLTSQKWEIPQSKDGVLQMPRSDAYFCAR